MLARLLPGAWGLTCRFVGAALWLGKVMSFFEWRTFAGRAALDEAIARMASCMPAQPSSTLLGWCRWQACLVTASNMPSCLTGPFFRSSRRVCCVFALFVVSLAGADTLSLPAGGVAILLGQVRASSRHVPRSTHSLAHPRPKPKP